MGTIASQITSLTIVYSIVYSDADQKTSKLRVTGLFAGNSPVINAQMAINAENVSIWWRHHGLEGLFLAGYQQARDSFFQPSLVIFISNGVCFTWFVLNTV